MNKKRDIDLKEKNNNRVVIKEKNHTIKREIV